MELQILHAIQNMHTDWLDAVLIFLTTLGEHGIFWIALSIVLALIPKTRKCGLVMMAAMAFSFLLGNVFLKNVIARPRPCAVDTSVVLKVPFPSEYSFPSGHSLNGFTAPTVLYAYFKKPGIAALILAGIIAFSRLYLFVHYPTDVLAGILLGIADACLILYLAKRLEQRRSVAK